MMDRETYVSKMKRDNNISKKNCLYLFSIFLAFPKLNISLLWKLILKPQKLIEDRQLISY
jgi:hypothetical protein